jgi:phosphatidylglycerol---prolipoprotein diacylglyceryl transferase
VHPVLFHIGAVVIPAYGAVAAAGILLALMLTQQTARIVAVDSAKVWNLCIVVLFAALAGSRLLLIVLNWGTLRSHPAWLLGLGMIHHPLLAALGGVLGLIVAWVYARWQKMPLRTTADALAAPLALGLAFEQFGALLAGSGYGTGTSLPWAVIYMSPLAARWSGAPIGIPVHPVQAYSAVAFLTIAVCLLLQLGNRRQQGDSAGLCLMGMGVAVYITEFWRDPVGRGAILGGFLRGPQVPAVVLVLLGASLLLELGSQRIDRSIPLDGPITPADSRERESIHG